jgi:mRNA-degrading endonuclease RelE of RelBE toxin-antitoxin system
VATSAPGYTLYFTNPRVARKYNELVAGSRPADQQRFAAAEVQLRLNPYPNPAVPAQTIRKTGTDWRYKVSYGYRVIYRIDGQRVIILDADDRKDIYR